jgi:hypothetical protein
VGESAGLKSISAYLIWLGKGFRRTKKGFLNMEIRKSGRKAEEA